MLFSNFEDGVTALSVGAVNVGDPLMNQGGDVLGFAMGSATAAGTQIYYRTLGLCTSVTKSTADAWSAGTMLYWDNVALKATRTPTAYFLGYANAAFTAAAAVGDVVLFPSAGRIAFQAIAASTAITNTTAQTPFSTSGFNIPAGVLTVGSVIRVRARATVTGVTGTPSGTLALLLGATALISTGSVAVLANGVGIIDATFVVRTIGTGGTLIGSALAGMGVVGTATGAIQQVGSTAVNTTIANAVNVDFTWSAASASNTVILDELTIEIVR